MIDDWQIGVVSEALGLSWDDRASADARRDEVAEALRAAGENALLRESLGSMVVRLLAFAAPRERGVRYALAGIPEAEWAAEIYDHEVCALAYDIGRAWTERAELPLRRRRPCAELKLHAEAVAARLIADARAGGGSIY